MQVFRISEDIRAVVMQTQSWLSTKRSVKKKTPEEISGVFKSFINRDFNFYQKSGQCNTLYLCCGARAHHSMAALTSCDPGAAALLESTVKS